MIIYHFIFLILFLGVIYYFFRIIYIDQLVYSHRVTFNFQDWYMNTFMLKAKKCFDHTSIKSLKYKEKKKSSHFKRKNELRWTFYWRGNPSSLRQWSPLIIYDWIYWIYPLFIFDEEYASRMMKSDWNHRLDGIVYFSMLTVVIAIWSILFLRYSSLMCFDLIWINERCC